MTSSGNYGIVITTFSDDESLSKCVSGLLEQQLAACIQQIEGKSSYRWEGKIARDDETIVFIKTRTDLFPAVREYLEANHPYDVPEIILVPIIDGSSAYLGWMDAECRAPAGA